MAVQGLQLCCNKLFFLHIVPCGKFHRIGGAPPETFPSENYDAPEELGGDRKLDGVGPVDNRPSTGGKVYIDILNDM